MHHCIPISEKNMAGLASFVYLFLTTWIFQAHSFTIPYSDPSKCTSSQYFRYSSLGCVDCGSGKKRSEDGLSCVCNPGYKITEDNGGPDLKCESCFNSASSSNKTTSLDGWSCVKCPVNIGFDQSNNKCFDCPTGSVAVDRALDGRKLNQRTCVKCSEDTKPASEGGSCRRCHSSFLKANASGSVCDCPTDLYQVTGGVCVSKSELINEKGNDLYTVTYDNDKKIVSSYFKEHFQAAQALCKAHKNFTACQLLGNLCVLLYYTRDLAKSNTQTDACKTYQDIADNSVKVKGNIDWPINMPWLYYLESDQDAVDTLDRRDIKTRFTANGHLTFTLSIFTLNGSFVGLVNSTTSLHICQDRETKMAAASKFATTFISSCSVPVSKLLSMPMYFYDMYLLLDYKELYAIPVLVQNYKYKKELVNTESDRTNWQLTRRFFLVENLVGKTSANEKVSMIRYAKEIEIIIRLRSSNGEIYPPYLKIKYDSVDVSNPDEVAKSSKTVSYRVSYEMNDSDIRDDTLTAIGCLSGLGAILGLIKVLGWRRRYGTETIDCPTLMKWVLYSFGSFSTMYFWIITGLSLQWLIFFKQQETVYRFLPTESQGKLFQDLLIIAFVFKIFDVVHMIVVQISIDIFFIDWERPRGRVTQPSQGGDNLPVDAPVSIWRTLFVANEWNEIQTMRKISPEFQIFSTLFFLKVVGFEHLATTDPISRFKVDPTTEYIGEYSPILRYAVLVMVYLCIECVQWFYFAFIYERFVGDALGDFVDLCSMANVSIFIMENTLFGYYIHGRSVHGRADTNMKEINEQIKREEEDLCGKRGLEPNSDHQTFEAGLPHKFRQQYNQVVQPLRHRDQQAQRRNLPSAPGATGSLPVAVERSIQAYIAMNRFLSGFIDHSLRDLDYLVYDKLLFERIFNIEVREQPVDKAIFYKDDGKSFNAVLFYGNEWTLMLFDLLFFGIVDYIAVNYVLAGVLTYFMSKILVTVRDSFGRKNLARKTMVDERFLI